MPLGNGVEFVAPSDEVVAYTLAGDAILKDKYTGKTHTVPINELQSQPVPRNLAKFKHHTPPKVEKTWMLTATNGVEVIMTLSQGKEPMSSDTMFYLKGVVDQGMSTEEEFTKRYGIEYLNLAQKDGNFNRDAQNIANILSEGHKTDDMYRRDARRQARHDARAVMNRG